MSYKTVSRVARLTNGGIPRTCHPKDPSGKTWLHRSSPNQYTATSCEHGTRVYCEAQSILPLPHQGEPSLHHPVSLNTSGSVAYKFADQVRGPWSVFLSTLIRQKALPASETRYRLATQMTIWLGLIAELYIRLKGFISSQVMGWSENGCIVALTNRQSGSERRQIMNTYDYLKTGRTLDSRASHEIDSSASLR